MIFVVFALATWRLASLFADEQGPGNMFGLLRRDAPGPLAAGLSCLWCVSVWIGGLWAAVWYAAPDAAFWLALPFALSAATILIEEVLPWR